MESKPTDWCKDIADMHLKFGVNPAVRQMDAEKLKALDRKSTRLNSSHVSESRMPSSA